MRTAILASGRGSNLQALIDACRNDTLAIKIIAVGSDHAGAGALKIAEDAGILTGIFQAEDYSSRQAQEDDILRWLRENQIELLLLAGYMRVLGPRFLRQAEFPVLNIHPSLLPAFPGLHAQRQALEYGVKVSGCTVHFVDEGLDSGPIILQEAVPVLAEDTEESLSQKILAVEHRLYPEAVRLVSLGKVKRIGRRVQILQQEELG
ncbi:phosphoribosylglycinamide formyltransferase, formyltetrahydrofolate-dependent [Desulfosporosinus orientis DSM 765]|uniref:Phosphoribosylglycinamide formyltransferase n=1 Tax=Desulfosporosinus orientis (strain ATCC 19365 / DSM 765 / NCIMB 8382 / VKM B-1628 / Singapore I) TaxID=768706 RepID=G7W7X5_DESOD|nr:phosphoribosylglycinamide formyltransferase [Desulfosporosinus orientis]AET66401.1 phosphoribosylglycinamide formyltransferase, formyltetrahydrofolate-dependent [Desulfosporosinus orientis DSM 765]